jgi:hypothetical protein
VKTSTKTVKKAPTTWGTRDPGIAAFLMTQGVRYLGAADGVFVFRREPGIPAMVAHYENGNMCSARELVKALRFLTGRNGRTQQ